VFSNVARKYDIMNDAMSFGLHRIWKNAFIEEINPNLDMKLIDVAGGTGKSFVLKNSL
jgi:ubiquinone/menaquinone biosynthesis C-methylase UbiE